MKKESVFVKNSFVRDAKNCVYYVVILYTMTKVQMTLLISYCRN